MTRFPSPTHPEARRQASEAPGASCDAVFALLRRIGRALDVHSRYLAQHHGLTGPQLLVLRELYRSEGCTVGRLADAICVSQATLTGIIDRLERKGLVGRRRDSADKRRVVVEGTRAGRRVLNSTPSLLHDSFVEQFTRLDPQEQTKILASLQRLVAMLEPSGGAGGRISDAAETSILT